MGIHLVFGSVLACLRHAALALAVVVAVAMALVPALAVLHNDLCMQSVSERVCVMSVGICIVLRQFAQHNQSNRCHCLVGPRGVYATFIFRKLFNDVSSSQFRHN